MAFSLEDNCDLRVLLSVFYIIVEVFRCLQHEKEDSDEFKNIKQELRAHIGIKRLRKGL